MKWEIPSSKEAKRLICFPGNVMQLQLPEFFEYFLKKENSFSLKILFKENFKQRLICFPGQSNAIAIARILWRFSLKENSFSLKILFKGKL